MSTLHWKRKKFDIITKSLRAKRFLKLSWNDLSYEIHSVRRDLLKTGEVISDSVISDKCKTTNNIILTKKNETLNGNKKISNTFNEYFTNITKGLNLRESTGNIDFENEESCKKIKENFGNKIFLLKLFPRRCFIFD